MAAASASTASSIAAVSTDDLHDKNGQALKWNGWGYTDTEFVLDADGNLLLTGNRYSISGVPLPSFRPWCEAKIGLNVSLERQPQSWESYPVPPPARMDGFIGDVRSVCLRLSQAPKVRVHHAHGHTCQEIYELRHGRLPRLPDAVIWPRSHEDVVAIVAAAVARGVVLVPFGGGTSVSGALAVSVAEPRPVVAVNMQAMARVLWVDKDSMTACIQAGAVGLQLAAELEALGVTLGHEPDSFEFSTLGGWIATRASGMQKNQYGNIEDIVLSARLVTPVGTLERFCPAPRVSLGPDPTELVLGSEGMFGIVTDAIVKVRRLPESRFYGALVFPDFEAGIRALREIAAARAAPASIRLVDNNQFQMGQALKPAEGMLGHLSSALKRFYVTRLCGYDVERMVAATMLFVGAPAAIAAQHAAVLAIAARHGGMAADEASGRRGYELTFMIAYVRDLALKYSFLGESFETSVPWPRVAELSDAVKRRIVAACAEVGVPGAPFMSARVTQTYDSGACVYFYFAFCYHGMAEPVAAFNAVEHAAREEILHRGGSLSHHHGVGKHRLEFMPRAQSASASAALAAVKDALDPSNVFALGNWLDRPQSRPQHPASRL